MKTANEARKKMDTCFSAAPPGVSTAAAAAEPSDPPPAGSPPVDRSEDDERFVLSSRAFFRFTSAEMEEFDNLGEPKAPVLAVIFSSDNPMYSRMTTGREKMKTKKKLHNYIGTTHFWSFLSTFFCGKTRDYRIGI